MKKAINYLLIVGMAFSLGLTSVFAEDEIESNVTPEEKNESEVKKIEEVDAGNLKIGDKFIINNGNKEYTVVEEDEDKIFLNSINGKNSERLNINHFEVSTEVNGKATWRKFVNLSELCNKTNICEVKLTRNSGDERYNTSISIMRKYENPLKDTIIERDQNNSITNLEKIERDMYYTTSHNIGSNDFESRVYVSDKEGRDPFETTGSKDGTFYNFGDNTSEKFDRSGRATSVDVESFIDSNKNVYISLRFLSEALGCRVDWLEKKIDSNTDAVLIRFYDSDDYCKKLEVTYPNPDSNEFSGKTTISSSEMYDYILKLANKGSNKDLNVDINYSYWDDSRGNVETGTTKWLNLYLSGNSFDYKSNNAITQEEIFAPLIEWDNKTPGMLHFYKTVNDENYTTNPFVSVCPSQSSNQELTSLEECIDVNGIFMYYGVPIPIKLLSKEADHIYSDCDFDQDTYEYVNKR